MEQFRLSKYVIAIAILAVLAVLYVQKNELSAWLLKMSGTGPVQTVLSLIQSNSLLPGPLRMDGSGKLGELTTDGVILHTNNQRALQNLPALSENSKLNKAAENKMQDMFALQYFEHESPTGKGPSDLAEDVGYDYLLVGENLAEGDFSSDEGLVQAWMDSPGHRANILHDKFREIGVAVGRGQFEGRMVWMAVQSFGVPAKICPAPSLSIQAQIADSNKQIDALASQADAAKNREDWNTYNSLVEQLNPLIENTKTLVNQYNLTVDEYNNCLANNS